MTTLLCWQGQRRFRAGNALSDDAGGLLLLPQLLSHLLDVFEQLRCVLIVLISRAPFGGAQLYAGRCIN